MMTLSGVSAFLMLSQRWMNNMKIYGKEKDNKIRVERIVYNDKKVKNDKGIIVDSIPNRPDSKRGVNYDLYYDKNKDSFFYEEVKRDLTVEERVEVLEEQIKKLWEK